MERTSRAWKARHFESFRARKNYCYFSYLFAMYCTTCFHDHTTSDSHFQDCILTCVLSSLAIKRNFQNLIANISIAPAASSKCQSSNQHRHSKPTSDHPYSSYLSFPSHEEDGLHHGTGSSSCHLRRTCRRDYRCRSR